MISIGDENSAFYQPVKDVCDLITADAELMEIAGDVAVVLDLLIVHSALLTKPRAKSILQTADLAITGLDLHDDTAMLLHEGIGAAIEALDDVEELPTVNAQAVASMNQQINDSTVAEVKASVSHLINVLSHLGLTTE